MRIVERLNLNCAGVRVDVVKEDGAGVLVDDGMADTGGGVADFGRTMQNARLESACLTSVQRRFGLHVLEKRRRHRYASSPSWPVGVDHRHAEDRRVWKRLEKRR